MTRSSQYHSVTALEYYRTADSGHAVTWRKPYQTVFASSDPGIRNATVFYKGAMMEFFISRSFSGVLLLAVVLMLLSACTSLSPDKDAVPGEAETVNVATAQQDPGLPLLQDASLDSLPMHGEGHQVVRWGGSIVRVENLADQQTLLEIVSRPLRRNGRPVHNDRTYGRFLARVPEFLDPVIVEDGRDITFVGSLVARQQGNVGRAEYVFPVLDAQTYTYWKKPVEVVPYPVPYRPTYHDLLTPPWILFPPDHRNRRP